MSKKTPKHVVLNTEHLRSASAPLSIMRYGKVRGHIVQGDPPLTLTAREW